MPSNGHGGRRRGTGRPRGAVGRQDRVLRTSWASVARKHADAALATLAMIMKDNGEPAAVRVRAANDVLDRGYGRPPTQSIEVLTPPSEIPELPTQREIEAELKRRGLPTVSELVAQERDRKAAVTAARPEIQPRFAQQRRAAPARDQLEICDRTARDLEVQFTATWSDGPIFELRERKMRPTRQHNPGRCEAQPNKGRLGGWIV